MPESDRVPLGSNVSGPRLCETVRLWSIPFRGSVRFKECCLFCVGVIAQTYTLIQRQFLPCCPFDQNWLSAITGGDQSHSLFREGLTLANVLAVFRRLLCRR